MTENPWITAQDCAKKRNGPSGALTPIPALDIRHCRGASAMPKHVGNIGSTESASNTSKDNWQSVGKLAARLVGRNACYKGETAQAIAERKVGEVMHALDNDDFLAAKMATESLGKFLAEYAEARQ